MRRLHPALPADPSRVKTQVSQKHILGLPNPQPHSCHHCQQVLVSISTPSGGGQNDFRCRLPVSRSDVSRLAKTGCPLFRLLFLGYRRARSPKEAREFVSGLEDDRNWKFMLVGAKGHRERLVYFAGSLSSRPFQLRILGHRALFATLGWTSAWFDISSQFENGHVRPVNRLVSSDASFGEAVKWLAECTEGGSAHKYCASPQVISFVPSKLLEVDRDGSGFTIRLCEPDSENPVKYCCLSYCWGGDQPVKTTKSTLISRLSGIEYAALPHTLKDAVEVTSRLGLRHIWIDCLCIVQDDAADVDREIRQMPFIYSNALLTISASSAKTCHEGFLQSRTYLPGTGCEDFGLRCKYPGGTIGTLQFSEAAPHKSEEDPVNSRAWTLQERALSPRILDYGLRQLRWQCRSWHKFDGGHPDDQVSPENNSLSTSSFPVLSHLSGGETSAGRVILEEWANVLDNYTKRSMSVPGDKLIAISALAREIGTVYNLDYLAGLWENELPCQLLWRLWGTPLKRPKIFRAPSWSWAAVDGHVMLERHYNKSSVAIEVLNCSTELFDLENPYGAVVDGYITVRGRLREGRWFYNRESEIVLTDGPEGWDPNDLAYSDSEESRDQSNEEQDSLSASDRGNDPTEVESNASECVLDSVELVRDCIEDGLTGTDTNSSVKVYCLQVLAQGERGSGEGVRGLILLPCGGGSNIVARRVGYFFFGMRKTSLFEGTVDREVRIV